MNNKFLFPILLVVITLTSYTQDIHEKDKGVFKEKKDGYYQNTILKSINEYKDIEIITKPKAYFSLDITNYDFPTSIDEYIKYSHNEPVSQGASGTCWCFSATSFLESEVKRLSKQEIKLSEMFTVYWEYVERARAFVKKRGDVYFAQGSEANAVLRMMKMHGAVPYSAYHGKIKGQDFYDHSKMFEEMKSYLDFVEKNNFWNEEEVVKTIKDILNHYMGEPPAKLIIENIEISPKEYITKVLKLKLNDYYSFMSTKEFYYNQKGELIEPDNW
ncbi:MAG: hypothetical protein K8R58_05035, partial [Bacteroidales bacterium]|nr:hypothetical protein [Bacteroidales bacterium]